ncbi:MAG: ribose-phosphate pyrophosphokinase [Herpetosiphonaceae bacterium]|nr:MAG: ribose-phosphate pyrophosphokinase [Herpetosiphonaceae bacterium]
MARFDELRIFSGSGNPELAAEICTYLGVRMGEATIRTFPNDNIFVKLHESVREQDVFVVQSLGLPLSHHIMELLILLDTCKRASAGRLTAVIPYYAYGRTDKKDQPRVPITARLLADLIVAAGADRVLTIDLHAGQIQGFFSISVDEMSAMHLLLEKIRTWDLRDAVIVSPGLGFAKRARNVAEALGLPLAIVEKRRREDGVGPVEVLSILGDVAGRHCILVDDEIATAQTMVRVAELLMAHGAREVSAAATHPVFVPGSAERLRSSPLKRVVVTNTLFVPKDMRWPELSILSVAPLLGEVIQRIHTGVSVGALFTEGHKRLGRW